MQWKFALMGVSGGMRKPLVGGGMELVMSVGMKIQPFGLSGLVVIGKLWLVLMRSRVENP